MLTCPICQSDLSDDLIRDGRCLLCGSLVAWQSECEEELALAAAPHLERVVDDFIDDAPSSIAHVELVEREPDPLVEDYSPAPAPPDPPANKESRRLSPEQDQKMRTLWQGTMSHGATPYTSLKANMTASVSDSTLVIRSRAVCDTSKPITCVGADYELLNQIGEGGMGVVYAARQASIDRIVALKMLRNEFADMQDQRDKFLSEAVVTAELDHPNIVPIHDLGTNESGALFYSMKRVQGTPWSDVMASKPLDDNLEILLKVCDAVAFAHQKGVVHRDLKPENTMLGDFGEVLVMDWGMALATIEFRRPESITQTASMGGTPAYMAPEMATGPVEAIGKPSDIYLLGAILYEIVTGNTPHTGTDPMDCLLAAAANRIQPTTKTSELLDVAMRAMATDPRARYVSAQDFQAAIRDYQSHAESILLSDRAEEESIRASQTTDYQDYASALFGFKEAAALWSNNPKAAVGVGKVQLTYAQCAAQKEDYDLAASLLDSTNPEHTTLAGKIETARKERAGRQQRLNRLKRMARLLVAVVVITVGGSFFLIRNDRNKAVAAQHVAVAKMQEAESAKEQEQEQRQIAEQNKDKAEQMRSRAEQSAQQAKQEKEQKEYETYLAKIGLASERIQENAFSEAATILNELADYPGVHWEFGRLRYLCREQAERYATSGRVECVAIDHEGKRLAAASRCSEVLVWSIGSATPLLTLAHPDQYVYSVAFSPDGKYLASGSSDKQVRIFDAADGRLIHSFAAHNDCVLSVAYSPDGSSLLTTSYDNSAKLWDIADLGKIQERQVFRDHSWWVWHGEFSPSGDRLLTTGHDGKVFVRIRTESDGRTEFQPLAEFSEHQQPVFCARFSPDGKLIASAGTDKRILLWDPERIAPVRVQDHLKGIDSEPLPFRAFDGHVAAVRSLCFSPDGKRIVSGCAKNSLNVWDTETGQLFKTLRGHEREIRSVVFAPDGRRVLSGSYDKTVRCWDIGSYNESRLLGARALQGHLDAVMSASFSPDGKQVVTACRDRKARIWNSDTDELQTTLSEGHEYLASAAIYFRDGRRLLTAGGDDTVRTWDLTTGTEISRLEGTGHDGVVALSHDEQFCLTANGHSAKFWQLESGQVIHVLEGHQANITSVACSRGGEYLFTADATGHISLWNSKTGKQLWLNRGHTSTVSAAAFLTDDQTILTASGDHTVARWNTATGAEEQNRMLVHPAWVSSLSLSADGSRAVTSCDDSLVRVWDLNTNQLIGTLDVEPTPATFATNLRRIIKARKWSDSDLAKYSGLSDESVKRAIAGELDPQTNIDIVASFAKTLRIPDSVLLRPKVSSASISADGKHVVTTESEANTVRLWDAPSCRQIARDSEKPSQPLLDLKTSGDLLWAATFSPGGTRIATLGGNEVRIWNVATAEEEMSLRPHGTIAAANYSPDGKWIVTASWDNTAKIWDAHTGHAVWRLAGNHTGNLNSAVFSPDGRHVLTASDDGTARLWDSQSGEASGIVFAGHSGPVKSATFSADGRLVATASMDRTARLWDAATGQSLMALVDSDEDETAGASTSTISHRLGVLCAAFLSADNGLRVVTGGEDGIVKIWDASTGQRTCVLEGHIGPVTTIGVSTDGRRLVTGSRDSTAKIWDAATGKEVLTLTGHGEEITSARFSPDDRLVLTSSRDGLAIIWPSESW